MRASEEQKLHVKRLRAIEKKVKGLLGGAVNDVYLSFENKQVTVVLEHSKKVPLKKLYDLMLVFGVGADCVSIYTSEQDYYILDYLEPGEPPQIVFDNVDVSFLDE